MVLVSEKLMPKLEFNYNHWGSCNSSVSIVTRLQTGRPGFHSWQGQGFLFSSPSRPDLLWGLPNLLSNENGGHFPQGVKRLGEADLSLPSSVEVNNVWKCTSTPSYIVMAWCVAKYRDSLLYFTTTTESQSE
jgi:hypothetical protein